MLLELAHVTKVYSQGKRAVRALDDASLQIDAGEFVSLIGPSGCGKTTLLKVAGGLLRPDTGAVIIDGAEPYTLTPEQRSRFRARHVGFVFQQFHLVPYLSVRENILSPVLAFWESELYDRADALIDRFGLVSRRDHRPSQLSTGEKQRTALARALLLQPQVILADEPTGNLDADNADLVLSCLRECAQDGAAVLLVTHAADSADKADRVIPMEAGQCAEAAAA